MATERLSLTVAGNCMSDVLPPGSRIEICRTRTLLPGDVVVIPTGDTLVVHRVIGRYRRNHVAKVLTQADNATRPDMAVPLSAVVGRVVSVDGHPLKITPRSRLRAFGRFLAFAWNRMRNA
jgi:phage repressor protein C with HTH and peptisase S24 domain